MNKEKPIHPQPNKVQACGLLGTRLKRLKGLQIYDGRKMYGRVIRTETDEQEKYKKNNEM